MKIAKRTRRIEIRLTETEYTHIKEKCIHYNSIGQYIRNAINEYSDIDARGRLQRINILTEYYKRFDSILFHATANLNQSMKRANELSRVGQLSDTFFRNTVWPSVTTSVEIINDMRNELKKIIRNTVQ